MKTPAPIPGRVKPVTRFRAVPTGRHTYTIEHTRGGPWEGSLAGLSRADVDKQFAQLRQQGAVIEEFEGGLF